MSSEGYFLFILVGGVILVFMLFKTNRGRGGFKIGDAEFLIDFENSKEWRNGRQRQARNQAKSPPANYYLMVKGSNWRYPLRKEHVYIGRNDKCQIKLRDQTADLNQAVIYWEGGRYRINNMSSRVPTYVNNRPITIHSLEDGNIISMGKTRLVFRSRR